MEVDENKKKEEFIILRFIHRIRQTTDGRIRYSPNHLNMTTITIYFTEQNFLSFFTMTAVVYIGRLIGEIVCEID